MTAFEIVENDYFDATQGKSNQTQGQGRAKPQQRNNKPKQQGDISQETAMLLNGKIKELSKLSGETIKATVAMVEDMFNVQAAQFSEEMGQKAVKTLEEMIDAYEMKEVF